MRRFQNTNNLLIPSVLFLFLLMAWECIARFGVVPDFMLPAPTTIFSAALSDRVILWEHLKVTLSEAAIGLSLGTLAGVFFAVLMDLSDKIKKALYPLIVLSQTIPTVAVAPLLVLWFGYGILPKVLLVALTTFFPIAVGVFEGFKSVREEYLNLFKSMGASRLKIYSLLKFPFAVPYFFAGLKISVSYAIVGAVISEWLGGFSGLGVYMTRVRKAYAFDRMFAVIFIISIISLLCMGLVSIVRKVIVKWEE